jgi:phage terminase small subunit
MPVLKNAKWEAFAQGLAKGLAVGDAYVNAGYKDSPASATRLSKNVKIQARVDELVAKGADRAEATVERVLKEMARLGFGDIRKAFDDDGFLKRPEEWDDDFAAAVASIEVVSRPSSEPADEEQEPQAHGGSLKRNRNTKIEYVHKIKLWDKNSALEKLAKHLGMFIERHEHTGKDGGPFALIVSKEDAEL